ncbi:hypothetical protein Kpol_1018p89 [Vanderwaltozyma polyspora DSM 70294]|uniref:Guanine-nucleotide exchange factor YEL1 n=1 Tax=Vanderwaltozyma polyspora (strain ATCC 22028 / DSM 70294 / BCRC 21397 / CBS 2163 / NBRC 10782 / NRRL Y-8283 / UCD 57-17) TaxID=436907 RepID=YEL1_VANPO|nr:uncharacterized protein Kpol_1018p89 [Vanderwaltozyma polyspora DSM 70294]A7TDT6.1 RecName: Full=Guanine-nucleotide exchange factor YEL1 [Vanderwaltozyma polyspora DSM 70294]EDO19556.1 hypothetical protein Kpol_1018p89 [Vanderwaltozyma polyspora DSM 70294]
MESRMSRLVPVRSIDEGDSHDDSRDRISAFELKSGNGFLEEEVVGVEDEVEEDEGEDEDEDDEGSEERSDEYWLAVSIFDGNFDGVNYKEYANYLGSPDRLPVLKEFIKLLQPLPNDLLGALGKLSSRLYFIAEAQNIDRILEELSGQWMSTHTSTIWGDNNSWCHIVLFSLLLLNSDLHNDENIGKQSRFTCKMFIENTLYALRKDCERESKELSKEREQDISQELAIFYENLRFNPLPLFTRVDKSAPSVISNIHRRQRRSSGFSTKSPSIHSLSSTISHGSSMALESHTTSNWKFHHNLPLPILYLKENFDNEFVGVNGTFWTMDGVLSIAEKKESKNRRSDDQLASTAEVKSRKTPRKLLFSWLKKSKKPSIFEESNSPVAFLNEHSQWSRARIRITEGRIFIFKLKNNYKDAFLKEQTLESMKALSSSYVVYNLFEALAEVVQENVVIGTFPSSNNILSNRGNFTITIPMGLHEYKVSLEFQTDTVEEAYAYVQSINFWAARLTPVPSAEFEIVSNDEYGWGSKLLREREKHKKENPTDRNPITNAKVSVWYPLLSLDLLYNEFDNIADQTELIKRLQEIREFTEKLECLIDKHNEMKPRMVSAWAGSPYFEKVMDNWNRRYLYLNKQYEKTSIYMKSLTLASEII